MFNSISSETLAHITSLGTDVFVLLGTVALLAVYGFTKGKGDLLALLVSVFPATLLSMYFPYMGLLSFGNTSYDHMFLFGSFLVISTLLLRNYISASYPRSNFWRMVEILTLSIACTGLIVAVLLHVFDAVLVYTVSPVLRILFMGPVGLFWWLIGSLAAIPLFVRA